MNSCITPHAEQRGWFPAGWIFNYLETQNPRPPYTTTFWQLHTRTPAKLFLLCPSYHQPGIPEGSTLPQVWFQLPALLLCDSGHQEGFTAALLKSWDLQAGFPQVSCSSEALMTNQPLRADLRGQQEKEPQIRSNAPGKRQLLYIEQIALTCHLISACCCQILAETPCFASAAILERHVSNINERDETEWD